MGVEGKQKMMGGEGNQNTWYTGLKLVMKNYIHKYYIVIYFTNQHVSTPNTISHSDTCFIILHSSHDHVISK